ncbi:MAG: hypothetical protein K2N16_10720, partial [Muribaculaceae bacterium]|nr:hypothetical protein [Muribaculaceae bacterium]
KGLAWGGGIGYNGSMVIFLDIDGVVSQAEKNRRARIMLDLSDAKLQAFSEQFVGQTRPVLIEHPEEEGVYSGFTDNYLRVDVASPVPLVPNTIVNARLDSLDPATMDFNGSLCQI